MKCYCFTLLLIVFLSGIALHAQVPQGFRYQTVVRDNAGTLIANGTVGLRLTVHDGSVSGPVVYQESHSATTNSFGLVAVTVGQGSATSGTFSAINWGSGGKYLKVELDPPGPVGYTVMGSSQLLSVPYALHAGSSVEADPVFSAAPASGIAAADITNWNNAFGWGDHSSAGYLTSFMETDPVYTASPASGIAAADITNWNNAFGWGDHSTGGYLTSFTETDPVYSAAPASGIASADITNWNTAFGWGNHSVAGYLTSFTETDPIYTASPASGIAAADITNWNNAFGWGDHSTQGYLTSYTETDPSVVSSTTDKVPKWSGTGLVDGTISDVSGKVGIGTTSPDVRLHVAGQVKITGGTPGAGKILTSDATGLASWLTAAGGGLWSQSATSIYYNAGKVGIGTSSPEFKLSLDNVGGIIAKGSYGSGDALTTAGAGTRLIWYPRKAAFRAGYVSGDQWNNAKIGGYSIAMGYNTTASGSYSTAMGSWTTASGNWSTAMGYGTTASGSFSTAMGYNTTASGYGSTAMGNRTKASRDWSTAMGDRATASGFSSTAMGAGTTASGNFSTAMGNSTTASGSSSTAMGTGTTASGSYSTAMGSYVSTNGKKGSFAIGDISTSTLLNVQEDNQMRMRFARGYVLFTNSSMTKRTWLSPGGTSWNILSDSTKKENIRIPDGEAFLQNLAKLRLGSWNYKDQDPRTFRHYGPMAQEIFHYFGNDGIGTIGSDTTLTTADMDGIMMICLQALEKRTAELRVKMEEIELVTSKNSELRNELSGMRQEARGIKTQNSELRDEVSELRSTNTVLSSELLSLQKSHDSLSDRNTAFEARLGRLESAMRRVLARDTAVSSDNKLVSTFR